MIKSLRTRFAVATSVQLLLLAAAALVGLVGTAGSAARSAHVLGESAAVLDHTQDVLVKTNAVSAALAEIESDGRAYVLTGALEFRRDFDDSAIAFRHAVEELSAITSGDAVHRARVATIDTLSARRLELLRELIVLRDEGAPQSAIASSVFHGESTTRELRRNVVAIRAVELARSREQAAAAESALQYAEYAPWIMCSIALVMFALMLVPVIRSVRASEEADRMKDRFLATLSHELRSPLTTILGWSRLLADKDARAELLEEGLGTIEEAARAQSRLVEDLLDTSRITAGKLTLCLQETDVAAVIERAIASCAPAAREKGVTLRAAIAERPSLLVDPSRIEQILWNLIGNAVRFTPAGKTIEVALQATPSGVRIVVRDEGEGIGPDLLPYIFDRFRQGPPSRVHHGGLGLGLAIVKHLAELHGGTVRAESEGLGRGATFTVDLPDAKAR